MSTKLFAVRGYHGTRMDDIARALRLNKATLYHYYASKSLILYDICQNSADFTVNALTDNQTASARQTLHDFTFRLLVGIADDVERAAVYFQEAPYFTDRFTDEMVSSIRRAESTVYERIRNVIDRGIDSGEFYDCDSHALTVGFLGMALGAYRWLRPDACRTAPELATQFSTTLLRGLVRDETLRANPPLVGATACSPGASCGQRLSPAGHGGSAA